LKILVVDDEPLVRRSLQRAAERRGHEVQTASNGLEGLEQWILFSPDLIFLDVLMPEMDGPTLLLQKPKSSEAKVVMMSAFTGEYDSEAALKMGAHVFIPKPFEDIMKVISQAEELVSGNR